MVCWLSGNRHGCWKAAVEVGTLGRTEQPPERVGTAAQALALRARIVLGCAQGATSTQVAQRLGVTLQTVGKWRQRFIEQQLAGWSMRCGRDNRAISATRMNLGPDRVARPYLRPPALRRTPRNEDA
ncbi:MAG: helix-turn-helix domain-containing protein [Candidatus Accumulibacter necessarius]